MNIIRFISNPFSFPAAPTPEFLARFIGFALGGLLSLLFAVTMAERGMLGTISNVPLVAYNAMTIYGSAVCWNITVIVITHARRGQDVYLVTALALIPYVLLKPDTAAGLHPYAPALLCWFTITGAMLAVHHQLRVQGAEPTVQTLERKTDSPDGDSPA